MGKILSQQQIEQYHEEGFISPIDVMSEDEAATYLAKLEQAERDYPEQLNPENRNNAHLAFKFLDEIAFHPIILDAVEDLLGPNFSLWGSVLFIKEPQSQHFVSWHQDSTYAGVEPHDYLTPWLALTPSTLESGCMTMLPRTQHDGIRPHDDTYGEDNILTRGQNITDIDTSSGVDLILRPGQMSIHHARTIHASQPNHSNYRRVGFALQSFVASGGQQVVGDNCWLPVRGECDHGEMIELQRPQYDAEPGAVAQRQKVNENFSRILYHGAEKVRAY